MGDELLFEVPRMNAYLLIHVKVFYFFPWKDIDSPSPTDLLYLNIFFTFVCVLYSVYTIYIGK